MHFEMPFKMHKIVFFFSENLKNLVLTSKFRYGRVIINTGIQKKIKTYLCAYPTSPVDNQNDLELDFKVFFFADSCCSGIVIDESN